MFECRSIIMRFVPLANVAVCLLGLTATSAQAGVIAGNFGPGDSYNNTGSLWGVGFGDNFEIAVAFTNSTSLTFELDQFRFAAAYLVGTNTLFANLYGGSTDLNSASLLE